MAAVPGVARQVGVEAHHAGLRVPEAAGELGVGEGREQFHPAVVERLNQLEGDLDRQSARVHQFSPFLFVVRLDGRFFFGQGQAKAYVGIQLSAT